MLVRNAWFIARGMTPGNGPHGGWCLYLQAETTDGDRVELPLGTWRSGHEVRVVTSLGYRIERWSVFAREGNTLSEMPGFSLKQVGRLGAAARMLSGVPGSKVSAGLASSWRGLAMVVRGLLNGGPRRAMYVLAARYQTGLLTSDNGRANPGAECQFRSGRVGRCRAVDWIARDQLELTRDANGAFFLQATGDDPQLVLADGGVPLSLPAGWYWFESDVEIMSGQLLGPTLYPDYGSGSQEYDAVRLPDPDSGGRIRSLILLKSHASVLRFDPSVRQVGFQLRASRLMRVGRTEALLRMLDRERRDDGSRDWAAISSALVVFAGDVLKHGLSGAAGRLHSGSQTREELDYGTWVRLHDTLKEDDLQRFAERVAALPFKPLISILVPAYQTHDRWLRRCLDSVQAQVYTNWELCIVDDASPSQRVGRVVAEYAGRDTRIRFRRRETNGHISVASNDALAMAMGEYVALLDHDDELRPHALLEMVEAIQRHPDAGLLYSDEDKIDERGHRFQPYFKPDWNPDLLRSQNYVCHFTVIRMELVRQVGGFRVGYEGSQDHDLFLRCTEQLKSQQVVHVPKVLYHWRAIEGSTALERSAKDYASEAGVRAVADHLSRIEPRAQASDLAHGHYRVRWPLPDAPPRVSIIIPTRDRLELLETCVESIWDRTDYPDYEVLVVDNQSREPKTLSYLEQLDQQKRGRILKFDVPFNYSAINNMAAEHATGDVLCLLNNDIEVISPDWLSELVSQAIRPGIGAVGPMLYYPDRTIQHAGVILGLGGVANHIYSGQPAGYAGHGGRALVAQNLSAVTGACLVVTRDRYLAAGGLDERLQVAFNDIDFCLRLLEIGLRNVWTPFVELIHHESASRGRDESGEKWQRFLGEVRYMENRWGDLLSRDPAYNPNLSLDSLSSGFACPRSETAG